MKLFSALVTGANRGIGLEFVRQLAKLNPSPKHIFATYRNKNTIQELKDIQNAFQNTTNIHLIQMDVTNEKEINDAVEIVKHVVQENGLTLLINNAAVLKYKQFSELTSNMLKNHFCTNTVAPLLISQVFYPLLKTSAEKQGGSGISFSRAGILNISSMGGSITNSPFLSVDTYVIPYKISKAALNMGMRVVASSAKKDNIITIMMCPGWVKTDMGSSADISVDLTTEVANLDLQQILPEESVCKILDTLSKLNETHNGTYVDRFGNPIAY